MCVCVCVCVCVFACKTIVYIVCKLLSNLMLDLGEVSCGSHFLAHDEITSAIRTHRLYILWRYGRWHFYLDSLMHPPSPTHFPRFHISISVLCMFCDDLDTGTFNYIYLCLSPPSPRPLFNFCVGFVTIWTLALLTILTYVSPQRTPYSISVSVLCAFSWRFGHWHF